MSRDFILCSVPFLQRSSTPSPLLCSLTDIINNANAPIKTVENVSHQYAALLTTMVQELEEEPHWRGRFIDQFGMEVWREQRFLLAWEAALLEAGLISRWIAVFKKT